MKFDELSMFAFLVVFVRCSAMFLSSPVFGSKSTPTHVRVITAVALSGALAGFVKPEIGLIPKSMLELVICIVSNAFIGLLIGGAMNLTIQAAQVAGGLLDLQVGLSLSQTLNPVDGVPVTTLSQFKYMLAMVIFLTANCHHFLINSLLESFQTGANGSTISLAATQDGMIRLLGQVFLIALQIAAPTMAVSVVIDAALGLVNRAAPQIQALNIGMPAKIGAGLLAVSVGLPALVAGVTAGTSASFLLLHHLFTKA